MWLIPERRRIARKNLDICFPELSLGERKALLRRHFESLGCMLVEMALGWWAPLDKLERLVRIEGTEHLQDALARGNGVILLTGHFTSVEITGPSFAHQTPPFYVLYRKNANRLINQMLVRGRERSAAGTIRKQNVRLMLKCLRANNPVWYAPDQSSRGKYSALVPFFGHPAMTNIATSRFARMSKSPVVPYLPIRLADDSGYLLRLLPALENFPSDDVVADTLRINQVLEAHIRDAPDQYYWVHRRFKDLPAEYGQVYAESAE